MKFTFSECPHRLKLMSSSLIRNWGDILYSFSGAFANLRKAPLSFVMSVFLFVRPQGTTRLPLADFREIYFNIFWKSVGKIQDSSTSDKNKGHFTWRPIYIFDHISLSSSRMRNVSDKICRKNQDTHFVFSNLSRILCRFEIMCKNFAEPGRPQMTIWRLRVTCWIRKATNKFTDNVILVVV